MAPDHDDGPPSASDFGGLVARVDELDRTVRELVESNSVLHVGHRLLIEQMAELKSLADIASALAALGVSGA